VGQGKARPDPAQTGLRHIQRHRRAHHRRAHPSRNGSARSRPIRKVAAKTAPRKRPHAIRKPKGVTFEKPGDVVQIDTLSIYPLPGVTIKHFNAYDPFAKWTVARPCKRATAKNAAEFLDAATPLQSPQTPRSP